MDNVILDSQILATLMTCPRKCGLTFVEDLISPGGPNNSFECGLMAHFMLEHFNKTLIKGHGRGDAVIAAFQAAAEYVIPYKDGNIYMIDTEHKGLRNTPEESVTSPRNLIGYKHVLRTMEEYFDFYKNESWTVLEAESVKRMVIYEDDELRVMWKAKFDQIVDISKGFTSVDHKTSKKREDSLRQNVQFMGQCCLLKNQTVVVNKIGWQTSLKAEEKFTRPSVNYSQDQLAEFANEIVPHYARMLLAYNEANYFPPQFTSCRTKYGICQFLENVCDVDRTLREESKKIYFIKGKPWDIGNDEE